MTVLEGAARPRNNAGRLSEEGRARVGERIKELRGTRALESVAEEAGISAGTLGAIERGRADPRLGTLLRLLRALGAGSIEELIGQLPAASLAATELDESPSAAQTLTAASDMSVLSTDSSRASDSADRV